MIGMESPGELTDSSRNPAEDTETDVDQEIRAATPAEKYRDGWEEDGEEVEKDI